MSFVDEEDVIAVIEPLYARIVREIQGVEVATPFPRMTFDEMMDRYGSDKPDLRYGMELADVGDVFAGTGFRAFASVLGAGGLIKALSAPGGAELSRKELDGLVQVAKSRGAAGLVWIVVESDGIRSPVEKHLSPDEIDGVRRATGAGPGDLVLIVADKPDRTNVALDGLRRHLADRLGLIPAGAWRFCWYSEPPLFDWSDDEGKWVSNHHPFTSPLTDDLTPETAKARAYDLTLNGFELGGGSIRIHHPDVQRRVFEVLGLTPEQTEEQFGHLLRAFRYGVPPHGGIAMGIDRFVMLMAGKDTIRDVTAFPKAQSGADPLTGAPAPASDGQLRELGIAVIAPKAQAPRRRRRWRPMVELTASDLALLTGPNFATFVTMNPDGSPHATITWVDAADGHVLVNTAEGRVKDRNCAANPQRGAHGHCGTATRTTGSRSRGRSWSSRPASAPSGTSTSSRTGTTATGTRYTPGQVREILKIRPDRVIRYKD